jgi:hypothetical protein
MTYATVDTRPPHPADHSAGMLFIRYGLGGLMVIGGLVMLVISPAGLGIDGFAIAAGGGLSVVLFNALFRLGLSSEADRDEEEQARVYFDEHGEWPEDKPRAGRQWILPAGVVTYEQEQARVHTRETVGVARDTVGTPA